MRARPDEAEGPSLALRRPDVEPEEGDENLAAGEEMQVDRSREQPDPKELRRREAEASADSAGARPTTTGGAGPPARSHGAESGEKDLRVQRRDARNNETAPAMTPTVKNRQRDVSESLAQQ